MIDSEVEYQEYEESEKNKRLGINFCDKNTDFERYKQLFDETGVKYYLYDNSDEPSIYINPQDEDEDLSKNKVIGDTWAKVEIFFNKDGSLKSLSVTGS